MCTYLYFYYGESFFPFAFVWFVGFCTGDFNKNKQILNRNEAATKMIEENLGREGKPRNWARYTY